MILVTGASGRVGGAAARQLAEQGAPVRALVRDRTKGAALEAAGAQLAVGDFTDPASLDAALGGVQGVVLASPGLPEQDTALVAAARRAAVAHVVYITSTASADSPIARRRWKAQVEGVLAASGVPHTLLRANAFMQNTLALAPAIAATASFASGAGAGRMGMVDARDVGAVAASIATDPDGHAGATYHLSGPAAISYADVADELADLLGRPITYRSATAEQDRVAMLAAGVPEQVAAMNTLVFSMIAEGDADWTSGDVQVVTGRPARSYRQFATDHLAAFRS